MTKPDNPHSPTEAARSAAAITPEQLRELDAQIERRIIGKCPHPQEQIKKAINDRGSVVWRCECGEDIAYVDYLSFKPGSYGYACPLYTQDWRAIMETLIPAMQQRGFFFTFEDNNGSDDKGNPIKLYTCCFEKVSSFRFVNTISRNYEEDGRIAICKAALQAVNSHATT